MRRRSSNSESGAILLIVIILMLALTITGVAFLNAGVLEYRLAKREDYKNKAFYIAEGGLERTIWNLKQDFVSGSEDWTDGEINGVSVDDTPTTDDWWILNYPNPLLGDGSYEVKLKYVNDPTGGFKNDEIWVRSTGTVKEIPRIVQAYVEIVNVFPWNNAIFAGIGSGAGAIIEGNSLIHGSVLILGKDVAEEAMVMDMLGTAGIRNNYYGMDVDLVPKVPLCPTEDGIEDLDAYLRVKQGTVNLGGTATVGEPNNPGDSFKDYMDGVYATGNYGGNKGADNVYSDNGPWELYDLGDAVVFPSLKDDYTDPVTDTHYPTYLDYLDANSLDIPIGINEISSDIADFTTSDGTNTISWDQSEGELHVEGIIWVLADSLDLGKKGDPIEYTGSGTIVVAKHNGIPFDVHGDIRVHGDLVAKGTYDGPGGYEGFPNNAIGLIANNIELATGSGESQLMMTAAFFAENRIISAKQNEIGGTFVSNYFDMGTNVPRIYQVPDLQDNLPPGMPGGTPIWYISTSQWSEVSG
jgi:hypothetical protein